MTQFKKFSKYGAAVVAGFALGAALLLTATPRVANAAVTAGVGTLTANLSNNLATGTGAFTALAVAPTIPEGAATDIPAATGTSTLTAPTGWSFNTAATLTVAGVAGDITAATAAVTNSTTITITITAAATATSDTLTINGITIRPDGPGSATGNGAWANGTMTIAGLAGDTGITITAAVDTGNYARGGSTAGAASTVTGAVGGATTFVTAQGVGVTQASFSATAGTFASNGGTSLFCNDNNTNCDTSNVTGIIAVAYFLPASGLPVVTVTPIGAGTVSVISYGTLTAAAGAVSAGSITTPAGGAAVTLSSVNGTTANISATFVDSNGAAPQVGAAVTVITSLGTLVNNGTAGLTCAGQSCTGTIPAGGVIAVTETAGGVSGTGTVTFTTGTVVVTKTFGLFGLASTLEVSSRRSNTATSFIAKGSVRNTESATTDQDELLIAAVAKDAQGTVVSGGNVTFTLTGPSGHTVVLSGAAEASGLTITGTACSAAGAGTTSCTDAIEAAASGATTSAHAVAYIDIDSALGEPIGTYTITATISGLAGATITGTSTFTTVKAPATLEFPATMAASVGGVSTVTATCKNADGTACPSGTTVVVNTSGNNVLVQNAATGSTGIAVTDFRTNDAGTTTITLVGVAAGSGQLIANVSTVTAVGIVAVSATAPAPAPVAATPGTVTGTIAPAGVSIVSFTGTTAQLSSSGSAAKVVSFSATVGGKMLTFVVGAPDFVNAEFNAAFPTGLTGTLVIAKT